MLARRRAAAAVIAGLLTAGSAAAALPVVVRVGVCRIEAPASLEGQARDLGVRAAVILDGIERRLGVRADAGFRMVLVEPGGSRDPTLALLDAQAPRWAAGYMLASERMGVVRVALASRYPYGTVESVFAHEVTHLLLHDAAGDGLPRWFHEGVATREGRRWGVQDVLLYASSLLTSRLPALDEMDAAFGGSEASARLAYAASSAFVGWAERAYGAQAVPRVIRLSGRMSFDDAWGEATGVTLGASERRWRDETLLRYRWIPLVVASGALWSVVALLSFVGAVRKRARARAARAAWDAREPPEPSDGLE